MFGFILCLCVSATEVVPATFTHHDGYVDVAIAGRTVAQYTYKDDQIPRPYFCHVRTLNGQPVTRNHPPIPDLDATDHPTFHPGVWLAFGDLAGADSWRLKDPIKHVRFLDDCPAGELGVVNHYYHKDNLLCSETARFRLQAAADGLWLLWDSEFTAEADGVYFGDQEEMGLGIRVATPLAAKNGGKILNHQGDQNEKQVWGKQTDWLVYSAQPQGQTIGVLLIPHRDNFGKCWMHARDYGFVAANPFGRHAFTGASPSRVPLEKDRPLRLRFAILFFDRDIDPARIYQDF